MVNTWSPDQHTAYDSKPSGEATTLTFDIFRLSSVYKVFAVVVLALLLRKSIYKSHKSQIFPAWATIEIAVTGIIIKNGGLSKQILWVSHYTRVRVFM